MPRTLSQSARAEKNRELRQQFPMLEELLDAFRDNGFSAPQVMEVIRYSRLGGNLKGDLSEKFAGLDDAQKDRLHKAAHAIVDGYAEFFEARQRSGVATSAPDAIAALEGDIGKICNFNQASPHHKARQGIENFLAGRAQNHEQAQEAPKAAPAEPEQTKAPSIKGDTQKLAVIAGTAAGVGSALEAGRLWRERVKKPESRKKALAFAGAAVVSLGAVAVSMVMARGGLAGLSGKLGGNPLSR
jgi:hypothetical protein